MALTQRDQGMVVACVLAAGLAFAYWNYLWKPKNAELARLQTRVEQLTERNTAARRDIASGNAQQLREEAERLGRVLTVMRRLVPIANEVPTLLDQISTAARLTGLDLGEVTPLGVIPGEVFDTHRFKMSVVGPYHRVARFLDNVGSMTRIVAPMNIAMAPANRAGGGPVRAGEQKLDLQFEIQTFVARTTPAPPPRAARSRNRGR
jgi:type IV pilus assembly protein PilO